MKLHITSLCRVPSWWAQGNVLHFTDSVNVKFTVEFSTFGLLLTDCQSRFCVKYVAVVMNYCRPMFHVPDFNNSLATANQILTKIFSQPGC